MAQEDSMMTKEDIIEQRDALLRDQHELKQEMRRKFPHLQLPSSAELLLALSSECRRVAAIIGSKRLEAMASEIYNLSLDATPE